MKKMKSLKSKKTKTKAIAMLLMISSGIAKGEPVSLTPDECNESCVCYTTESMAVIATGIKETQKCRGELKLYRERIQEFENAGTPVTEFWQQPGFVIGGIVVGISFGMIAGLLIK